MSERLGPHVMLDPKFKRTKSALALRCAGGWAGELAAIRLWQHALEHECEDGVIDVDRWSLPLYCEMESAEVDWDALWAALTHEKFGLLCILDDGKYRMRGWRSRYDRFHEARRRKLEHYHKSKNKSTRRLVDAHCRVDQDQDQDQDHDQESKRSERGGHTGRLAARVAPSPVHKIDPLGDPPDLTEPAIAPEPQGCPAEPVKSEVATQTRTEGTAPRSGQISQSDHFASAGRVLQNVLKNHQDDDFSDFGQCPEQEKALPSADSPFSHRTCAMVRAELTSRGVTRSWSVAELRELIDLGPSQATVVAAYEAATANGEKFRYGLFVSQLRPEARARAQAALQAKAKPPDQAQQKSAVRTESPRRAEPQRAYVPLGRMTQEESAKGAANARAIIDSLGEKASEGECKRERRRTMQTVCATEQTSPPNGDGSEVSGSL